MLTNMEFVEQTSEKGKERYKTFLSVKELRKYWKIRYWSTFNFPFIHWFMFRELRDYHNQKSMKQVCTITSTWYLQRSVEQVCLVTSTWYPKIPVSIQTPFGTAYIDFQEQLGLVNQS